MVEQYFVQAVHNAVSNLFNTMIPLDFEDPVGTEPLASAEGFARDLVGTIDIQGGISGSISILLSYPLAITMASLLLDESLDEVNEDVYEAVAEITNMIVGSIKTFLSQQGQTFVIGLPQVFDLGSSAAQVYPQVAQGRQPLTVPIRTTQGAFCVASLLHEEAFH